MRRLFLHRSPPPEESAPDEVIRCALLNNIKIAHAVSNHEHRSGSEPVIPEKTNRIRFPMGPEKR